MKSLLILIITIFSISNIHSYEVSGTLNNIDTNVSILEGESFLARINIWPMTDESLEEIKRSLQGKMFLDYFYVAEVQNIKFSENNSDVVVAHVKAVLTKAYKGKSVFIWTYKSLTIPFEVKNINPIENKLEKDFIILNQKDGLIAGPIEFLSYAVGIILILLSFWSGRKILRKRNEKLERKKVYERWKDLFMNTNDREGVEAIYQKRNEWLKLVGGETPPIIRFFEELDSVQYKREWTDIEEHKVLEAYDDIRGIFERS
ncbi:hypothetical protein [Halobacteriovorax sp.]|uniref:hypothetical protein n=1 Tax=Halobacteriovorax sp. TaxID=2020862 RepID=UPI0035680B7B